MELVTALVIGAKGIHGAVWALHLRSLGGHDGHCMWYPGFALFMPAAACTDVVPAYVGGRLRPGLCQVAGGFQLLETGEAPSNP